MACHYLTYYVFLSLLQGEAGGPPIKMCECVEKCRSGEHRPVCGENGNMYYNDCSLKCRNDTVTSKDISRCKKF